MNMCIYIHRRARVIFFGVAKIIKMCKASIRKYRLKFSLYTLYTQPKKEQINNQCLYQL